MHIKNLLRSCLHIFNNEQPNPVVRGRIRIAVEGYEVTNRPYNKKSHRDAIIAQALSKYQKIEIYITPHEQQKGRWVSVDNGNCRDSNFYQHFNLAHNEGA